MPYLNATRIQPPPQHQPCLAVVSNASCAQYEGMCEGLAFPVFWSLVSVLSLYALHHAAGGGAISYLDKDVAVLVCGLHPYKMSSSSPGVGSTTSCTSKRTPRARTR
jgi:hypothetical protein